MSSKQERARVAVLDDYQHVALSLADWSVLDARATVTVFSDFRCGYCRALSGVLEGMNVRVIERPISAPDFMATVCQALGIDHTKLTVRHNGIDRRLTDVHGEVISKILA